MPRSVLFQFKQQLLSNAAPYPEKAQARERFQTTIQRHQTRPILCKHCVSFYLEGQNHSIACSFHPNPYGLYCPKGCANPGVTPLCQSHRLRRWRCCDQTKADAPGCARRCVRE